MDYAEELRELLRPLGIYALAGSIGGSELDSIGAALNGVLAGLEQAELDALPLTATDAGLRRWEALLPFTLSDCTDAGRRAAVAALLRIREGCAGPEAVNDTVLGCGIRATVEETGTPLTVAVKFPGVRGIPESFAAMRERIEQILPCHLGVEYRFAYLRWRELEELLADWPAVAGMGCWEALERLGGEEA